MSSYIYYRSRRRYLTLSLLIVCSALTIGGWTHANPTTHCEFSVDDYFRLRQIRELALSNDGKWLVYQSQTRGNADAAIHLHQLEDQKTSVILKKFSDAHAITWIPDVHKLMFLASSPRKDQLYSYNLNNHQTEQLTYSDEPVIGYRLSPNGDAVAFLTRSNPEAGSSLYEQFRKGEHGILINSDNVSSHDFLNPEWSQLVRPPKPVIWVMHSDRNVFQVPVPGEVIGADNIHWSPDGTRLSITYVADDIPPGQTRSSATSLGIFNIEQRFFHPIAKATPSENGEAGISYSGGEWVQGKNKLLLRRVIQTDPWVSDSHPDWTLIDSAIDITDQSLVWRAVDAYPRDLKFIPTIDGRILLENTVEGVHSLFELTTEGMTRSSVVQNLDGSSSQFSFSTDLNSTAFVNQSLTRPPEIFIKRGNQPVRQVTQLNTHITAKIQFHAREISWRSNDGSRLKGWLLEPRGSGHGPWPLITHIHGGPAYPFPNAFSPYFEIWPYPLELFPCRGMAVFMPNYRGTHTYGRKLASPISHEEPIEDIISGVRSLVDKGIANEARLGITGQSHGAWLGSLAMAHSKLFRASSFAEGVANSVVMYELMSGDANREIHDAVNGASLYEAPERYLMESPDLHFNGLTTASLFEAGARTAGLLMLGFPKAAKRVGMPTEFIIYPRTAHNITEPGLQRESAERNLDWFEFWLFDNEDTDPGKAEQYKRWRSLSHSASKEDRDAPN